MSLTGTQGLAAAVMYLASLFILYVVCKAAAMNEEHPHSPDKIESPKGEHHV